MRVNVLYFGILKDFMGVANEAVELPEGAIVSSLLEIVRTRTSKNGREERVWQSVAVAINREYASGEVVLCDGDEVALLPPVSGGGCNRKIQTDMERVSLATRGQVMGGLNVD